MSLEGLLMVVALVCFVVAALGVAPRIPWLPVGLAFLAAGHIWTTVTLAAR